MKFGSGQPWPEQPPAIIVRAKRSNAYYEKALETCNMLHEQEHGRILKEWKESGAWKEKYDTWDDAAKVGAGISSRHANRIIAQFEESQAVIGHDVRKRLDKVKEEFPPEPEEDDEKPAVRAATPEQMKRVEPQGPRSEVGPTGKPSENGKPKHSLAIWKELSETHFGRALNRIDELNRQCPNPKYHAALIEAGKKCLAILEQWRQEVG